MTGRRQSHTLATPATAGRGEEPPARPCAELDYSGRPKYAHLFDAVLDHKVGPDHWRAVAACKAICATCPLSVLQACYRENLEHPGVVAGLTLDERVKKKPATRHPTCGKPHGTDAHRRHGEENCADCRAAIAKRSRDRARARNAEIQHGSDTGYSRHRKAGEEACDECTTAHRLMEQIRAKRRADKRAEVAA